VQLQYCNPIVVITFDTAISSHCFRKRIRRVTEMFGHNVVNCREIWSNNNIRKDPRVPGLQLVLDGDSDDDVGDPGQFDDSGTGGSAG
jgi:hypothetical protein